MPATTLVEQPAGGVPASAAVPAPVVQTGFAPRALLTSASALVFATGVERGFGFLANLLAARLGGAATFGGYSLAMTTANNIAAYAGAGIGSTATRFAGEHGDGTVEARAVGRALALVSLLSALVAAALLFGGARPLASLLLGKPDLAPLLEWAALPAATMILFECCRGFLVGQRRLRALVMFSGVMGVGMIASLPAISRLGAVPMVCTQAAVAATAIAAVLLFGHRSGTAPVDVPVTPSVPSVTGIARRVWHFGFVQLLGIVGLNAAGWWLASLVARADSTLVEMGLFAVASQLRNIVALVPGLLTQSSYAMMASEDAEPGRVLVFCTFVATVLMLLLGGLGIVVLPWLLPLAWGSAYRAGILAGSLALATAIVHMSGSAAAARLTILSLPITGIINASWSVLVVGASLMWLTGRFGSTTAATAMGIYLIAHTISAGMVLLVLARRRHAPQGLIALFAIGSSAALVLAALAVTRLGLPTAAARDGISLAELVVVLGATGWALRIGHARGLSALSLVTPATALLSKLRKGAAR